MEKANISSTADISSPDEKPSAIIDRLVEQDRYLRDILTDVEQSLEFFRLRRNIWDDWAGLIEIARQKDKELFIQYLKSNKMAAEHDVDQYLSLWEKLQTEDKLDSKLREFLAKLPKKFSDLQNNLNNIMVNRELLKRCKKLLQEN